MDSVLKDERFAHIGTDVRFRSVPKREQKIKIDKRFESMFTGSNFKVKYSVDKRGRPNKHSTDENLRKYYDLSSSSSEASEDSDHSYEKSAGKSKNKSKKAKAKPDEDSDDESEVTGEKPKFEFDYARGEGAVETSSSEEEEDSSVEEDEDGESELVHPWGELDEGALKTEMVTRRLAVCNMDWDRMMARDLYVLLNSFTPPGGVVKTVKVYLSDFGRERLREEEVSGPKELKAEKRGSSDDKPIEDLQEIDDEDQEIDDWQTTKDDQGEDKYHMEKLRQYQLNRLKYYYAVVECDSAATASKIYEECDGLEYESSAARIDLRYIPDDMEFDQEPHSVADVSVSASGYRPKNFTTAALQQATVKLTWDETNPDRLQELQKAFDKGEEENMDLGAYLASSDSESEDRKNYSEVKKRPEYEKDSETEEESDNSENEDGILKYRALLKDIEEGENKKNKIDDVHMEITWGTGLKEKAEKLVKNKAAREESTPWQQYLEKKREKRQLKREQRKKEKEKSVRDDENPYSDDEIPDDVNLDDPFFKQNIEDKSASKVAAKKSKKKMKQKLVEENEDTKRQNGELELLLMDDEDEGERHYNLKKLLKAKSKDKKEDTDQNDNFQINVADPRFSAIFNSHEYNLDPSDQNFKRTAGMEALIREKQKRMLENEIAPAAKQLKSEKKERPENDGDKDALDEAPKRSSSSVKLSMLIKNVKNNTSNFKRKNNKSKK